MRFFDEHDKGWGYIAPEIPEASIGVRAGHRGRGIGRSLLNALADAARATGVTRICLSVERDNIRAFERTNRSGTAWSTPARTPTRCC